MKRRTNIAEREPDAEGDRAFGTLPLLAGRCCVC
jgi:hypothetical protein